VNQIKGLQENREVGKFATQQLKNGALSCQVLNSRILWSLPLSRSAIL